MTDNPEEIANQNTDKEIWRKKPGDFYSPSIHATERGDIGIGVGGYVVVLPVERWHEIGKEAVGATPDPTNVFGVKWWEQIALWFCRSHMGFYHRANGAWATTILKHFRGRVYVMAVSSVVYEKQEGADETPT